MICRLFTYFPVIVSLLAVLSGHAQTSRDTGIKLYWIELPSGQCGYIDSTGEEIVKPQYSSVQFYTTGDVFWARKYVSHEEGYRYFLMHTGGRPVSENSFDNIWPYHLASDKWCVQANGKCGVLDASGAVLIPLEYDSLVAYPDGFVVSEKNRVQGYLQGPDYDHFIPLPDTYTFGYIGDGYFTGTHTQSGRLSIYDGNSGKFVPGSKGITKISHVKYGQVAICFERECRLYDLNRKKFLTGANEYAEIRIRTPLYPGVLEPAEDSVLIAVRKTGQGLLYCILDYEGNVLTTLSPDQKIDPGCFFSEGLCLFSRERDGKPGRGYINQRGEVIIPPVFSRGDAFSQGMAYVEKDGKGGFIDRTGRIVIPLELSDSDNPYFERGPVSASMSVIDEKTGSTVKKQGYINRRGEWIWYTLWPEETKGR